VIRWRAARFGGNFSLSSTRACARHPELSMTTHLVRRSLLVAGVVGVLTGCGRDPVAPQTSGPLRITPIPSAATLVVANRGTEPVFTFIVGRNASAVINWAPCWDAERCAPILPGAQLTVPYAALAGGASSMPETEAIVYWWHAPPSGTTQLSTEDLHSAVVRLRR
jgi:hypothetical protein